MNALIHPRIRSGVWLIRPLLLVAIWLGSASAGADTFTVTNQNNSGSGSLRAAVGAANFSPGPDTIVFDPSVTAITLTTGQIDITEELIIDGESVNPVISSGGAARIFGGLVDEFITIRHLELTGAATSEDGVSPATCAPDTGEGGAVCSVGEVLLEHVYLTGNSTSGADAPGGAVFSSENVFCYPCFAVGNSTQGSRSPGGALYANKRLGAGEGTIIEDNMTSANSSPGGGIYGRAVVLVDSEIRGNRTEGGSSYGGGIHALNMGNPEIRNVIVENNRTLGNFANGGGVYAEGIGRLKIRNSIIRGNSAEGLQGNGGGLYLAGTGLDMINSTVSGNSVAQGAGAGIRAYSLGDFEIFNSTVSGNQTLEGAGSSNAAAVYLVLSNDPGDRVLFANTTITDNHSTSGESAGGVLLVPNTGSGGNAEVTLSSSVLAGNSGVKGNLGRSTSSGAVTVNVVHTLFGDDSSEITGMNAANVFTDQPDLGPLVDNGCASTVAAGIPGGTQCAPTHQVLRSSPALDTGDNPESLQTDQRGTGFPRISGPATDIGAVECLCPDQFSVGGTVSGLTGGQLVLQNNGGDDQTIDANGAFTFPPQDNGTDYMVAVSVHPDGQFCSVSNATGTIDAEDVTDVNVTCESLALTVMPQALNFGDVAIGQTSPEQMLVLENTGAAAVELDLATIAGPDADQFAMASDTCSNATLAAGDFCGFGVEFTPGANRIHDATLDIDGPALPEPVRVPLRGTSGILFYDDFESGAVR